MNALPSQITAAGLATLVTLFIAMLDSLGIWDLDETQTIAVFAFVTAASNFFFGILLWYVNRNNPNPTAPGPVPPADGG